MSTQGPAPEPVVIPTAPELGELAAPGAEAARSPGLRQGALAADDPRLGLDPEDVLALSGSAGNAGVARLLGPGPTAVLRTPAGARVHRQAAPAAAPAPAAKRSTTQADKARLENGKRLVDKAKTNKDTALKALEEYSADAPAQLQALKANADKNLEMYKAAAHHANYIIGEAKEIAKIQDEVLMQIIGAALGGLGTALEPISEAASKSYEALKTAYGELSEFGLGTLVDKSGAGAGAKGALGLGGGEAPAPTIEDPATQELAFYKSYSGLQANSTKLLGVSVQVAKISEPIGKVSEAIKGVQDSGTTRSDYTVEKMDKDAATLESSSRGLAAAAPGVKQLLTDLKAVVKQAQVSAPKDAMEVEKDLWKRWAAGIDWKNTDILDVGDEIERYWKRIGIWDQLGIDRGDWFSDDEERLTVAAAKAHELVLQHKGEAVEFTRGRFGFSTIRLDGIPGSPDLPAVLDPSSTVFTSKVRAVVIDARTVGTLETEILGKAGSKSTVAEYLLNHGYIRVILRAYEDLSGGEGGAEAPD